VSQPIRDRIDLHISLQAVTNVELFQRANNNTIDANSDRNLQKSILTARNRQLERAGCLNASLDGNTLKKFLNQNAQSFLEGAVSTLGLSARSYVRTLRVARTIADLRVHEKEKIDEQDIAEALSYREGK
jgi:magnesium chelatase family protein